MNRIAIQYLENSAELLTRSVDAVRQQLNKAQEKLPINDLLLGWYLPRPLLDVCREEADRSGATFYRWHPLLTSDGVFQPQIEWQTIGLSGKPISGFREMPEFTFVCPNRPVVVDGVLKRVEEIIKCSDYQGVFLDRIRFPSPANSPIESLGCFCEECQKAAACLDIDLLEIRAVLREWTRNEEGRKSYVQTLINPLQSCSENAQIEALSIFLKFRCTCITNFVKKVAAVYSAAGMKVGLDCFSPMLSLMVGQDLSDLGRCVDWIKIMSYAHTFGPAGIPFELAGIIKWLSSNTSMNEKEAIDLISCAVGLPLPSNLNDLRGKGLCSASLQSEVKRGVESSQAPVLWGVELVEIKGVTELNYQQIREDLEAVRLINPAGLVLSWDLWDIPLERLDWVREVWL